VIQNFSSNTVVRYMPAAAGYKSVTRRFNDIHYDDVTQWAIRTGVII